MVKINSVTLHAADDAFLCLTRRSVAPLCLATGRHLHHHHHLLLWYCRQVARPHQSPWSHSSSCSSTSSCWLIWPVSQYSQYLHR